MEEIVYFSVNNWFCGMDYPPTKNFKKWLGNDFNQSFKNDAWCKKNKLCVYWGNIDMSLNYTVSAPKSWVEKNCPELLTDDIFEFSYQITGREGTKTVTEKKHYNHFVHTPVIEGDTPDEDGLGMPFREYCQENFGSEYYETNYWECVEDEDDEDE